jgi:hypothetical protein
MNGKMNYKVKCCFCGKYLSIEDAAVVIVKPSFESEEAQELFSHNEHLLEKFEKGVILHPDFFDD